MQQEFAIYSVRPVDAASFAGKFAVEAARLKLTAVLGCEPNSTLHSLTVVGADLSTSLVQLAAWASPLLQDQQLGAPVSRGKVAFSTLQPAPTSRARGATKIIDDESDDSSSEDEALGAPANKALLRVGGGSSERGRAATIIDDESDSSSEDEAPLTRGSRVVIEDDESSSSEDEAPTRRTRGMTILDDESSSSSSDEGDALTTSTRTQLIDDESSSSSDEDDVSTRRGRGMTIINDEDDSTSSSDEELGGLSETEKLKKQIADLQKKLAAAEAK